MKERPRAEVFDQLLVPALSQATREAARGELEESDLAFIRRVVGEILDDLEGTEEILPEIPAQSGSAAPALVNRTPPPTPTPTQFLVAVVAPSGSSDALTLRMLGQLFTSTKCTLVTIEDAGSPMQLADRLAKVSPAMVVLSHLHPERLAKARYQVRRLRARFAKLPILVGRWGEAASDAASEGLCGVGATQVALTLADARDQILARADSTVPLTKMTAKTGG